jgi:hypothetical protein
MQKTAHFPTEHATHFVATTARHFGHKRPVEVTEASVLIRFEAGTGLLVAGSGGIAITVEAASAEDLAMLADVVERHLLRFAFRENPAALVWDGA